MLIIGLGRDPFSQTSKTAKKLPIAMVVSELILVIRLTIGDFHKKAKKLSPLAKKLAAVPYPLLHRFVVLVQVIVYV